jgi:hypothetical protein
MAPESQNDFGVFFFWFLFLEEKGRFCWGFCDFWCAKRGFSLVNRGEFVVKTWWKDDTKSGTENFPLF